jgi:hypothetical protein
MYAKPPAIKPKRLGSYHYAQPGPANNWDATVLVWIDLNGRFWCIHPISGQWLDEETLKALIMEAKLDAPGLSEPMLKLVFDRPSGQGVAIVYVRYDFQYKGWFFAETEMGQPRKYISRLYEIPTGETMVALASAYAQAEVLAAQTQALWQQMAALRPQDSQNGQALALAMKPLVQALPPERLKDESALE